MGRIHATSLRRGSVASAIVIWVLAIAGATVGAATDDASAAEAEALEESVYICTARRMVAIGPRSLSRTQTIDEIRDLTLRRRFATVEEPRFREFVITVTSAEPSSALERDIASACRAGGWTDPACGLLPRWTLRLPAAKVASAERASADEKGRVALQGARRTMFRGPSTTVALTADGLFTLIRYEGTGRSEMEEGLCGEPGG